MLNKLNMHVMVLERLKMREIYKKRSLNKLDKNAWYERLFDLKCM